LRADAGQLRLLDGDPWRDAVQLHRRLAYVPGDVTLWPNLTGGEVIDLLGRLRSGIDPRRRADLIARFDLDPTKKGRAYSKGNRVKVALVAALASDVELLLLDEPTSGLDPLMEGVFRACIAEERHKGRTVLLSSHLLDEVEALCDRVTIIRDGKVVESGSLAELRHLSRTAISVELTRKAGEQLGGFKVGLTSERARRTIGADVRPFGYILAHRILASGATVDSTSIRRGSVEPSCAHDRPAARRMGQRGGGGRRVTVAAGFELNEARPGSARRDLGLLAPTI
jgi:ABC-2 type transport system ATP-binding protein